jgi:serine/threonine protein kinase
MEIIEGESLEARIRREGRLPPEEAARIVTEVAQGVAYAHERKIVHRDLKPANVLLDTEGHAFVTDFGLGRQLGDENRLTRTGEVLGTPWFMAPEQALGHSKWIDERADVYGLGAILYCALAGRPPFVGATALETIELVRTSPPDPIEGLSPALEDLLARVLAKNPDDRPQTALELASELDEALHARGSLPRGLVRALLVVAGLCVVATGALVARVLEKRPHPRGEADASPSPVTSASAIVRPSPKLTALLEGIGSSLDRKRLPLDSLQQLKAILDAPGTSEGERDRIRAVLGRVYDVASAGDVARFERFVELDLPLPDDPQVRDRLVRRWLEIAADRARNAPD